MSQNINCPQCGISFYSDYNQPIHCPMCGWGKSENLVITPPTGFLATFGARSFRYRMAAVAAVFAVLIVVTPLIHITSNQFIANNAITTAKKQMSKRLYASAAKTLNQAPLTLPSSDTKHEMKSLLTNTIRWAHDISDVKTAKKAIVAVQPDEALDNLDDIESDFPQEGEAVDLIDFAQDESLDPDIDVSDEIVDDIAYVPDDPEAENIEALATEAEEQLDIPPDEVTDPTATVPHTSPTDPADPTDPEITDPTIVEDPGIDDPLPEELPDDPGPDPTVTTTPAVAAQTSHLANLYQMSWTNLNKAGNPTDQDSFYTIDLNNEVKPTKDKKSGFNGYKTAVPIGQLYNRKVTGNKNIVPLYRYWSNARTDHFYTINPKFSSNNANANYVRQAVAGYIGKWDGTKCLDGTKPLYNLYNAKLTDNYYTANPAVRDALAKTPNWANSKVAGCIW